jgi:hypothetical protein
MPARKARKPRRTPTDPAAQQRDNELKAAAAAEMRDPDAVRRRVATLLGDGIPRRLLRFSLRNQLLILQQAEQRGITVTDIDTKKGWNRRGRLIATGQTGLRIVRPIGTPDDDTTTAEAPSASTTSPAAAPGDATTEQPRPLFRMSPRWDISQTVDMTEPRTTGADCPGCPAQPGEPCQPGCTCPACIEQADDTPAADVLWNSLIKQLADEGYRLVWPAAPADLRGRQLVADHAGATVYASLTAGAADPDAIAELAVILGDIIARAEDRRAAARALPAAH